jgi:multiple sugar transport system substrate-binding protein
MKKIFLVLIMILVVIGLAACNGKKPDDSKIPNGTIIELTYADWANQTLNQKLIDAFMVKYPNIRVTLRTDIEGAGAAFTGNLIAAAQADLLPDVFATDNVPTVINAGLTLDVAQYWDNDPDAALVYDNIALTGVYNGKRYAVPSFQFFKGIFMNLDIFERANLVTVNGKYRMDNDGYPVKNWTFSEFVEIAKTIKNFDLDNPENLVIGMGTWFGSPDFQQVWPTMQNASTQYDTWNGTTFNYTSAEWIFAMQQKVALHALTNGTTTRFDPADVERQPILGSYLTPIGYTAMDIDGSWQFGIIQQALDNGVRLGFWPYPQGSAGFFPPTILDYAAVSSQTQHPEEAFLLAKWMTFGKDGWSERLRIIEENIAASNPDPNLPRLLDRFPIANYDGIWERVYNLVQDIEGIDYIINNIDKSKPDLDKWLPGYKDFWAWVYDPENPYNFDNLVAEGPNSVATYALVWQNKVNELVAEQMAALGN